MDKNPSIGPGERWYAAATRPMKERFAIQNLNRQGIKTFCPLQKVARRHARKLQVKIVPTFPGYVFLILNPSAMRSRNVNGTYGVKMLLSDADGPLPLRDGVIETLISSTDEFGALIFDDHLRPGEKARLVAGPFADQLGVIESLDDKGRVLLLLSLFGRTTRVFAERTEVVAAA